MSWTKEDCAELELAVRIAADAHAGQVDKGGAPYILHPLHLMGQMQGIEEKLVAVLHDVIEDGKETSASLIAKGIISTHEGGRVAETGKSEHVGGAA